jgi:hypothetical protein
MIHARRSLLAGVCCLAVCQQALAARVIDAGITLPGGRVVLLASTGDNGKAGPDTVWGYLKRLRFGDGRSVLIQPDPDNPLRATLEGKVKVGIDYGGEAEVTKLRLIRDKKTDFRWRIDPKQVDEMAKGRKDRGVR